MDLLTIVLLQAFWRKLAETKKQSLDKKMTKR